MLPFRKKKNKVQRAFEEWLVKTKALGPENKKDADRVTKELQDGPPSDGRVEKLICNCDSHHFDPRYKLFRTTGPCVIFRCAAECPFCEYEPGTGGGKAAVVTRHGGTIRKHITNKHCGQPGYAGLYVISDKTINREGLSNTFVLPDENRAIMISSDEEDESESGPSLPANNQELQEAPGDSQDTEPRKSKICGHCVKKGVPFCGHENSPGNCATVLAKKKAVAAAKQPVAN